MPEHFSPDEVTEAIALPSWIREERGKGQPFQEQRLGAPGSHHDQEPPPWPDFPASPQFPGSYGCFTLPAGTHGQRVYLPVPQVVKGTVPSPALYRTKKHARTGRKVFGALGVLVILVGLTSALAQRALAFGSTISTQTPLSSKNSYAGAPRVNVLIMGYGGGSHDGANSTDSLVVASLVPESHHTSLVSVPRDLWVRSPNNSAAFTRINAVYQEASGNGTHPAQGGEAAAVQVSFVTGMNVPNWITVNFAGFRDLINAVGGVDVVVPDGFTTLSPQNDDPAIDPNYMQIRFSPGLHHKDGETPIRYARARKTLDNPTEGSDFARSVRQQLLMKAVLAKVKQPTSWPHLFGAVDALKRAIHTNMSLSDMLQFAMKMYPNDHAQLRWG